jgi:site-specific DNA-cytosine methylase
MMLESEPEDITYTAAFPFGGMGAGARGFLDAQLKQAGVNARFRSMGGIDYDAAACRDFEYLTDSPALCADISAMTVEDLLAFYGPVAPDVIFMSPPCKGASGAA